MASNDFKNSLKLLLTNIKDKHYTKKETELKLEEIKAIRDVEELPTENANENVFYRTTIRGNWAGTVVPNSGTVDKVYLNTQMPVEEVVEVLKKCDLHQAYNGDIGERYTVIYKKGYGAINVNNIIPGVYTITYKGEALFTTSTSDDFYGWNPKFNSVIEWGTETMSTYEDTFGGVSTIYPVGNVNTHLTSLFSTTSITSEIIDNKLFHIKNGNAKELQNKFIAKSGIEINDKTNEISSYAIRSASEVEEVVSGGWQGTVVPTSGMIESVYFNTELSIDEVVNIIKPLIEANNNFYYMLYADSHSTDIFIVSSVVEGTYTIFEYNSGLVYFASSEITGADFVGWNPDFDGTIVINNEIVSEKSPFTNIGGENKQLTTLFSITPFERIEETTEYIGNEKCIYGGGKSPVPNTGYVDKVYLDTSLSDEEVLEAMSKITTYDEDGFYSLLASITDSGEVVWVVIVANVLIADFFALDTGDFSKLYWINPAAGEEAINTLGFVGWKPNFNGEIIVGGEAKADTGGLVSGVENDKLVDLFYMGGGSDNLFYLQNKQKKYIATKEDLSIQDVKELPKDKKERVAIPTSGTVDTVYFNTDLSVDEVVALIDKLSVKEYYVFINEESIQSGDVMAIMIDKSSYSIYCVVDGVSNKIFTQSSGWDTSFPNSVTFNLQNDMTAMRHELQNDILVELMYCIKIEKEKINENVLYRVEENSGWQGTPVPNTGYVEKIYVNTNLSFEEIKALTDSLDLTPFPQPDGSVLDSYLVLVNQENNNPLIMINLFKSAEDGNEYSIMYVDVPKQFTLGIYDYHRWRDKEFENPITINANVVSEFQGVMIGHQNDKLSSLFSITPFVQATGKPQLYHFKDSVPYKVGLTKEDVIDIINEQFENAEEGAY